MAIPAFKQSTACQDGWQQARPVLLVSSTFFWNPGCSFRGMRVLNDRRHLVERIGWRGVDSSKSVIGKFFIAGRKSGNVLIVTARRQQGDHDAPFFSAQRFAYNFDLDFLQFRILDTWLLRRYKHATVGAVGPELGIECFDFSLEFDDATIMVAL